MHSLMVIKVSFLYTMKSTDTLNSYLLHKLANQRKKSAEEFRFIATTKKGQLMAMQYYLLCWIC